MDARSYAGHPLIRSHPGFHRVVFRPTPVEGLDWAEAEHHGPYGTMRSRWQRTDTGVNWEAETPAGSTALAILPDGSRREMPAGVHRLTIR